MTEAASAFRYGVASGDPTSNRLVIRTRVSGARGTAPVAVRWRVIELESARSGGHI